jgi:GH24 family phage-related lysozyme (muramidase)
MRRLDSIKGESACSVERRRLLAMGAASLWLLKPNFLLAQSSTPKTSLANEYEQLLQRLASDQDVLKDARGQRERRALALELGIESLSASVDRRFPPSSTQISERATKLIIFFEVSGEAAYTKQYKHPEWPGEQSGVTIGIGYDLGYASKETFKAEWQDYIDKDIIATLSVACYVKGNSAAELARSLQSVEIDWPNAFNQYTTKTQPIYVGETEGSLPNTNLLSADSLGALVSLVYNRGASFDGNGDRYAEMRNIKAQMRLKKFDQVPDEIRSMKRLWPNSRGLRDRREAEATLFELGLISTGAAPSSAASAPGSKSNAAPSSAASASGSGPSAAPSSAASASGSGPSAAPSSTASAPGSGPSAAPSSAVSSLGSGPSAPPIGAASPPGSGPSVAPSGAAIAPGSGPSAAPSAAPSSAVSAPGSGPSAAPSSAVSAPASGSGVAPSSAASAPGSGPGASASPLTTTRTRVEIVLTNGRVLRVDSNIDPEVLARLVRAIDR